MAKSATALYAQPEPRPLEAFDPADVDRVALRAFFALADEWQLSREEAIAMLRF